MKKEELQKTHEDLAPDVAALIQMPLDSDEDRAFLTGALQDLKTQAKAIEAKKEEATKPLNEALKAVRAWFKPVEDLLKRAETEGKRKILEYDQTRRAIQAKELERAVETGDRTALIRATIPEEKLTGLSKRKVWRIRVTDKTLIPTEYLLVDEKSLLALAREGQKAPPGVSFFQEETLAIGGR